MKRLRPLRLTENMFQPTAVISGKQADHLYPGPRQAKPLPATDAQGMAALELAAAAYERRTQTVTQYMGPRDVTLLVVASRSNILRP